MPHTSIHCRRGAFFSPPPFPSLTPCPILPSIVEGVPSLAPYYRHSMPHTLIHCRRGAFFSPPPPPQSLTPCPVLPSIVEGRPLFSGQYVDMILLERSKHWIVILIRLLCIYPSDPSTDCLSLPPLPPPPPHPLSPLPSLPFYCIRRTSFSWNSYLHDLAFGELINYWILMISMQTCEPTLVPPPPPTTHPPLSLSLLLHKGGGGCFMWHKMLTWSCSSFQSIEFWRVRANLQRGKNIMIQFQCSVHKCILHFAMKKKINDSVLCSALNTFILTNYWSSWSEIYHEFWDASCVGMRCWRHCVLTLWRLDPFKQMLNFDVCVV